MFIVFTTTTHVNPQTLTLKISYADGEEFFRNFCKVKELVTAILFDDDGRMMDTYLHLSDEE